MSSPSYYVYDGDVANGVNPHRPGLNDVGGAAKENDGAYPPDPVTMLTAEDENQQERILIGLARVCSLAQLVVQYSAGTPSIFAVLAPSFALEAADFTVTDNGDGDVTIQCSATHLPAPVFGRAYPQATGDWRAVAYPTGLGALRVETRDSAGALADVNFVVDWH